MIVRSIAFGLLVIAAVPAQAVVAIPGLFNSGRLANNSAVTTGTVQEQNWFLNGISRPWNSGSINGAWLANNSVSRWMTPTSNGTQITQAGLGTFNQWTSFSAGTGFIGGLNTLSFRLLNLAQANGNPSGLRVEILSSAYEPVPEPASWTMMIAGFGMVGTILRRRTAMA